MTLTGKQKAAMLLMSLDVATATQLLRGVEPRVVQELAVELSYLDAAGYRSSQTTAEIARQFCSSLQKKPEFHMQSFLKEMLKGTVGEEQAAQIETQIQDLVEKRDPFIAIRSADSETLASVLEGEHPQAVAVVLSEMPPKKSSAMLGLLGEGMRLSAISRMTSVDTVTTEAKARIAQMVRKRLEATTVSEASTALQARPEQSLRKVAIILRNVDKELRDGVLTAIQQKDKQASETITELMIVWNDIPQVADRSLQEALRGTDSRELALALHKADEAINRKVRSNISERAAAMVDEEISLMPTPKKEDVKEARENIVNVLREMNSKGELTFVEE